MAAGPGSARQRSEAGRMVTELGSCFFRAATGSPECYGVACDGPVSRILAWRRKPEFACAIGVAVLLLFCAGTRFPFAPLDEGGHFGYVVYMMENGAIPLTSMIMPVDAHRVLQSYAGVTNFMPAGPMPFYEAIQPPLYYALAAVIGRCVFALTHHWGLVFYAIRFFGAIIVGVGVYLCARSLWVLRRHGLIETTPTETSAALAMTVACPSVLATCSCVTNDSLAFAIGSSIFATLVHAACHDGFTRSRVLLLAFLSSAAWLTKLHCLFLVVLAGLCVFSARQRTWTCLFGGIVCLCVLPWHLYTFYHEGQFTGLRNHLAFVRPIVNPGNLKLPLATIVQQIWQNQMVGIQSNETFFLAPWQINALQATAGLLIAGLAWATLRALGRLFSAPTKAFYPDKTRNYIAVLCAVGCWSPLIMCCVGSYVSRISTAVGRYTFPGLWAYTTAVLLLATSLPRPLRKPLLFVPALVVLVMAVGYVTSIRSF
jgi:hypothetical protein